MPESGGGGAGCSPVWAVAFRKARSAAGIGRPAAAAFAAAAAAVAPDAAPRGVCSRAIRCRAAATAGGEPSSGSGRGWMRPNRGSASGCAAGSFGSEVAAPLSPDSVTVDAALASVDLTDLDQVSSCVASLLHKAKPPAARRA